MNTYFSNKIKLVSFISILLVLYVHSDFHNYPNEILGMPFNHYLQISISRILGNLAVPLFYCISGYLFFCSADNWETIKQKLKRRVSSLIIPYIIAATAMVSLFIGIKMVPAVSSFMNGQPDYLSQPINDLLYKTYIDNGDGSPIAFHLWFLRDLIVIMAATPILYFFHKKRLMPFVVIALAAVYLLFQNQLSSAFFYFTFGAVCLDKKVYGRINPILAFIAYLALAAFIYFNNMEVEPVGTTILLTTFLGVISVWDAIDEVLPKDYSLDKHKVLSTACKYTFFNLSFSRTIYQHRKKADSENMWRIIFLVCPFLSCISAYHSSNTDWLRNGIEEISAIGL